MKLSNVVRVIISYLFLIAAFGVYFIWSYIWLEALLIFFGLIILLSAIHLHRKNQAIRKLKNQEDGSSQIKKTEKEEGAETFLSKKKLNLKTPEATDNEAEGLALDDGFTVDLTDSSVEDEKSTELMSETKDSKKTAPVEQKVEKERATEIEVEKPEKKAEKVTPLLKRKKDKKKTKKTTNEKRQTPSDSLKEIEKIWEEVEKK